MPATISTNVSTATDAQPVRLLTYQELDILHCLRGFCAFYVVVYHAKFILWAGGREYLNVFPRASWNIGQYLAFALDMLSSAGYEMVIFFFVLSGFFIRYAQLRKHRAPLAFYLNRIVRIYPPYLFSVLLAVGVLAGLAHFVPQMLTIANSRELNSALLEAWNALRHLDLVGAGRVLLFMPVQGHIFLGYNEVYWSLLPEAMFYALVPLAFWRIRAYYVVSLLLYLLGAVAITQNYPLNDFTGFFASYNAYFALGAALHDVVVRTKWLERFRRVPGWLLWSSMLGLFAGLIGLAILKMRILSGVDASLLAVLAVSALLAGRVSPRNWLLRIFHPIGIFSFSLYLYHFPLLLLCGGLLVALTGDLVFYTRYYWLAIPVVTLACYALYWCTERVSINFFRKV
ncbi:acyltransferase [Hymenobacter sp. ASUV-10]|uniref:Acyltransferase n=1 Tax=Hymenobacter aranciens TaxID=3063996 RepID=A0ABT9B8Y0_9BACT|nr:acyltransferase [Hymenobacter sp. ASUV-10]MDO7874179.1 acyltransferase [Hymenobacter sp. ASUV-10]